MAIAEILPPETTTLALVQKMQPADIFKPGGIDAMLEKLKVELRAMPSDVSTPKGRKEIASRAHTLARSKTFIDGVRKNFVADEKKRLTAIDQEGARIWDEIEALQAEVRKPLTDWENAEEERVAGHKKAIEAVHAMNPAIKVYDSVEDLEANLATVTAIEPDMYEEFRQQITDARAMIIRRLEGVIADRRKTEAERAELERLRAEAEAQKQRDRDAQIAREAIEKEQAAARERELAQARAAEAERLRIQREADEANERAAKAEAARVAAIEQAASDAKAAEERAERERLAGIERERVAAEKAEQEKKDAETRARLAAEKAEVDRVKAEETAKADQAAAIEAERKRVEALREAEREATAARERDMAHKAKINREIRDAMVQHIQLAPEYAEAFVRAMAKNLIPNVKIVY